jgi:carbon monoxide dehydrogenase subunit G
MASVSKTAEVAASRQDVWAKLTDLDSAGEWLATHVDYPEGTPDELVADASYKEKVTIMGMPGEVTWTVISIEAESHLEMKGQGPMGTELMAKYSLAENGDGTTITFESGFEGAALAAMEAPLLNASEKALGESLEKLSAQLA